MKADPDMIGKTFGRLTVLRATKRDGRLAYTVVCSCGVEKDVNAYNLIRSTRSCGCLTTERRVARNTKHGMRSSKEYQCWADIIARCTNPRAHAYADYGARGVTVCERWYLFENFIEDMGMRPVGMSIERKDVNGNYEPDNCVWASNETQANNRRGLRKYMVEGEWLTASQLGRRWGITQKQAKVQAARYESKIIGETA